MGELLALTAALCYGVTHFGSGVLSKRFSGIAVAAVAQFGGTVLIVLGALTFPGGTATAPALAWGALSGIGAGLGMACMYRGFGRGRISVVAPVSDVSAVALPVLAGLVLFDERPSRLALYGIALALPATWLVSRTRDTRRASDGSGSRSGAGYGLLAGTGVAMMWIALAQVPAGTGLWPLVASRAVSVLAILPLAAGTRTSLCLPGSALLKASAIGAVGTLATVLYTFATRQDLLTVAVVLTALYPAIPVLLAVLFLGERLSKTQTAGLACAGAAVCLIALG